MTHLIWIPSLIVCFTVCSGGLVKVAENITAMLGEDVSLTCKLDDPGITITQVEWFKCDSDRKILVYNSDHGANINEIYLERATAEQMQELRMMRLQERDFGQYCCKLSTFPSGSLERRINLYLSHSQPKSPTAVPKMMIVYIVCGSIGFLILCGVIAGLLIYKCRRRRVRNPVHVSLHVGGLSPNQPSVLQKTPDNNTLTHMHNNHNCKASEEEEDNDDMYLNVIKSNQTNQ